MQRRDQTGGLSVWGRHAVALPLVAAGVAAALLGGVAWVAAHEVDRTVRQDAQSRVRSNRDAAIRAVDSSSGQLRRAVAAVAENGPVVTGLAQRTPAGLAGAQSTLATLAAATGSRVAFLSDVRGRAVVITPPQPELIGRDFSYRDWFQGVSRSGRPYVSSAYRSAAAGHPLVVGVAAPVMEGVRRLGYVTLVWELSSVRAVAAGAQRDDGVSIAVADQRGQPLVASLAVDVLGQPLPGVRGPRPGAGAAESAFGPVPGLGWTVTAYLPSERALAPARAFRRSLGLTLGASLLLVLLGTAASIRFGLRRAGEQEAVERERQRLTALFAASPVGIVETHADGTIVAVNAALERMLGYAGGELLGTSSADLLEPGQDLSGVGAVLAGEADGDTREWVFRGRDGSAVDALVSVIATRDTAGAVLHFIAFVVDQREQRATVLALRAAEERLTQLALHDELTGLPNRRLLLERLAHALVVAGSGRRDSSVVAVMFVDLDGFKPVNDRLGHAAGDQLLCEIALDLSIAVRPTDTVARVGGDEFVVLLEGPGDAARDVAARLTAAVRRDVPVDSGYLTVSASVGLAQVDLAVEPGVSAEQLLARADRAMYQAKERGRDRFEVYAS